MGTKGWGLGAMERRVRGHTSSCKVGELGGLSRIQHGGRSDGDCVVCLKSAEGHLILPHTQNGNYVRCGRGCRDRFKMHHIVTPYVLNPYDC